MTPSFDGLKKDVIFSFFFDNYNNIYIYIRKNSIIN
jgi:hypothetical protein